MKPVQLLPAAPVVASEPKTGGVLAIALVGVVVLAIGGYFGWAKVSTVKANTAKVQAKTQETQTETANITAQITEAGQKSDFTSLASSVQQTVVDKVNQRTDFARFTRELAVVVDTKKTGTWLTAVNASPNSGDEGGIEIRGMARNIEAVSALLTRLNATGTIEDASLGSVANKEAADDKVYVEFSINAKLEGASEEGDAAGADPNAQLASNSSGGDGGGGATELSLEPEPGYDRRKKAARKQQPKAKPLSSLEKLVNDTARIGGR